MTNFYLTGLLICGVIMIAVGVTSLTGEAPDVLRAVVAFGFGVPSLLLWFFLRIMVPRSARRD